MKVPSLAPTRLQKENGFSLVEPKRSQVPAQVGIHALRGFSLVELAIVLVILGLLTGGILAGQSLIRAAESRKRLAYISQFQTAWHSFRDKYFYIPGDMPNATSFWGRSSLATDGCLSDTGTPSATGTCNGNGDGKVNWGPLREHYQVFYQLRLAGLDMAQPSTGGTVANGFVYYIAPGPGQGLMMVGSGDNYAELYNNSSDAALGANYTGNALQFARHNSANNANIGSYVIPEDMWNIDTKYDDGRLQSGNVRASNGYVLGSAVAREPCVTGTNPNYEYNLSYTSPACKFSVKIN